MNFPKRLAPCGMARRGDFLGRRLVEQISGERERERVRLARREVLERDAEIAVELLVDGAGDLELDVLIQPLSVISDRRCR